MLTIIKQPSRTTSHHCGQVVTSRATNSTITDRNNQYAQHVKLGITLNWTTRMYLTIIDDKNTEISTFITTLQIQATGHWLVRSSLAESPHNYICPMIPINTRITGTNIDDILLISWILEVTATKVINDSQAILWLCTCLS